MKNTLDDYLRQLKKAIYPVDLFGNSVPKDEQLKHVTRVYRIWIQEIHPDKFADLIEKEKAEEAVKLLNKLWEMAQQQIAEGSYEEGGKPFEVKTKKNTYKVGKVFAVGDMSNLYKCSWDFNNGILKVALNTKLNSRLENENRVLKDISSVDGIEGYIPKVVESFILDGKRATVFSSVADDLFTLAEVKEQYPKGLHPRDFAWMWNRTLEALLRVHSAGYIHGAMLPTHMLINPINHGMVIVDWCHSVKIGENITIIPKAYKDWYPPEVLNKKGAYPGTDLYLAAKTMSTLVNKSYPARLVGQLEASQMEGLAYRAEHAGLMWSRFQEVLEEVFGTKQFHEFVMERK